MIALCVRPPTSAVGSLPAGAVEASRHGWSAVVRAAAPYGFVVAWERGWICGESVRPVDDATIRTVAEAGADLELPDDLLGLVVVDAERGLVVVASSLRSVRPYYLHHADRTITLATSLLALRDLGVPLEADEERFAEVLVYRFVAPPNTLCRGVRRLVGGEVVTVDLAAGGGLVSRLPAFADPETSPPHDEAADLDRLHEALVDDIRMTGGTRPGALLSGGLDSSLLTALARRSVDDIETWSTSFDFLEAGDQEGAYAVSMADVLGVSHHAHRGSEEAYLESLVRGVHQAEMPLHHLQSGMFDLLFAEVARTGHDALLCGEGADGLFGTSVHEKLQKYRHLVPWLRRLGIGAAVRGGLKLTHSESERWRWFALGFGKDVEDRHHLLWTLGAYGSPSLVERRFGSDRDAILGARRLLYTTYGQLGLGQQVSVAGLLLEASTTMVIWSRLAERFGVALPCPYTSPRTIRLVAGIPWKIRLAEPKHLVRALLRREGVPESLIARPKLSFGFPYRHWAVRGALLQPLVDMAGTMFEPDLLRSFQTEQWDEAMILWNAVGLYLWRSLIVEGADPDALVEEVLARHRARVGAGRAG